MRNRCSRVEEAAPTTRTNDVCFVKPCPIQLSPEPAEVSPGAAHLSRRLRTLSIPLRVRVMKVAAVTPLRSGSRSGSNSFSGAKTFKKVKKDENERGRGSDNAAAYTDEQIDQDTCPRNKSFYTPSLPCWAAAEHNALEQLTDAFFTRHRLHLRVWPVSAGGGTTAGEAGGTSTYPISRSTSTVGEEATSRKGRASTAAATGKDEQSKKEGRGSNALEKKGSGTEPLRRAAAAGASRGLTTSAERNGSRRGSIHKDPAGASEAGLVHQMENMKGVKGEDATGEEENEATRVRREQLLNVRAMLYDRVTENVSFTCTEYNTPFKPSRNANLPSFLRLRGRGSRASETSNRPLYKDDAGGHDVADAEAEGEVAAAGATDNAAVVQAGRLRQVRPGRDSGTADGEMRRGEYKHCESSASCAVTEMKKEPDGAEQRQQGGPCSVRSQQSQPQSASTATATAGRKHVKLISRKSDAVTAGNTTSNDTQDCNSKQRWIDREEEALMDDDNDDVSGDPGKLKELQQSLLSDGFTGCWVLLLTEKYIPADSPTALSTRHSSQTSGPASFALRQQAQERPSAGEQSASLSCTSAVNPAAGQCKSSEEALYHTVDEEKGSKAPNKRAADDCTDGRMDATGVRMLQQEPQQRQQPRVRRIIVCGALIEVYSNNERQIAALWCLPCLSAHATRLLLQAFLPRVLLEALRIPDVAAISTEEKGGENSGTAPTGESSSSKKRKWKQEGPSREAGRGGDRKHHQRQQRSNSGGTGFQKKLQSEERQAGKQRNGCSLYESEQGRRRKSSSLAEVSEFTNISAVPNGDGQSGTHLDAARIKYEDGKQNRLLRPIKSVFAVFEDILLWPRQALFLLAAPSRLGFLRHAEPLLGVPAEEADEECGAVAGRKTEGTEEKQRRIATYRKQPYLHVDAGLGPEWRHCNCRTRFFLSPVQISQQRKHKGANVCSNKALALSPAATGKAGVGEDAINNASSRKNGTVGSATAGSWGGGIALSSSRNETCSSKNGPTGGDGLLRFFSVSDLWAARLMPPREKRTVLQQAESLAAQQQPAAGRTHGEAHGGSASSASTTSASSTTAREKVGRTSQRRIGMEPLGDNCNCGNEATKQEGDTRQMIATETADAAFRSSAGDEGKQGAAWTFKQEGDRGTKGESVDIASSTFWPVATDGWSCLVPQETSEQILREIYCDLAVLSETRFEECLSEKVDITRDEMCGLRESECRELLRWWE